ncbi:major facilitator superfamily protein [Actinidia rufa]|uniref:Major facilitator superfamily protein n=1 Tax=Actinidia rufa TaxID=165716 RepID=A0A7J0EPX8_9ERIC|nr:major facilitator superfamily protein [Actinidia rufa]
MPALSKRFDRAPAHLVSITMLRVSYPEVATALLHLFFSIEIKSSTGGDANAKRMSTIIFHAWSANRSLPTCLVSSLHWSVVSRLLHRYCSARDTITEGNLISSRTNETLISVGAIFELGFFTINRYRYVDGKLTLSDENGNSSYFSVSVGSSSSSLRNVTLLDSGNLVVRDDQSGKSSWESFNNPTDTFLPGMKMDENLTLTSWSSENDPRSGNFTFQQDQGSEKSYKIMNRSKIYWKSRETEPQDSCSVYSACGDFGVCNSKNLVPCKCLPGFEPVLLNQWKGGDFSSGCNRKLKVCGKEPDTFLDVKMMKVGIQQSLYPKADKKQSCETECLSNCQCQAYFYNDANYQRQRGSGIKGCWIWAMPPNSLQEEYAEDGYNISVRVVASSIGSTARECKPCGTNVIPYPLSTGKNCGDPMYFNFFCNSLTGQVRFQTLDGTFWVTSINPETRKFVIETKISKEHCERLEIQVLKAYSFSFVAPFKVLDLCYAEPGSTRSEMQQRNMDEVEFGWNPPPEPLCNSSAECKDWPNSSCNATVGVTGRCQSDRDEGATREAEHEVVEEGGPLLPPRGVLSSNCSAPWAGSEPFMPPTPSATRYRPMNSMAALPPLTCWHGVAAGWSGPHGGGLREEEWACAVRMIKPYKQKSQKFVKK